MNKQIKKKSKISRCNIVEEQLEMAWLYEVLEVLGVSSIF